MNNIYDWKKIGQRIKEERKKIKLSQQELADKIFISSRQTIANWENGSSKPQLEDMICLCNLFQCELGYLLVEPDYSCRTRGISYVHETTGLSEEAITNLSELFTNSSTKPNDQISHEVVDLILKTENDTCLLWNMGMYIYGDYINESAKKDLNRVGYNKESILLHMVSLIDQRTGDTTYLDIKDIKEGILLKVTHQLQNLKEHAERNQK